MRLKPGTQNSQTYRLRGKGVPSIRGGSTGDQLVHVEIDVPTNLTQRQKELIEALGSELGTEVQIPSHSILEKIKHLFD
jgi:molecular chaperone DnaJ